MSFSSKRGRSRRQSPAITLELQYKHAIGQTLEPLDRLLKEGRITTAQHWAGNHLRWLHSLRFGTVSPRQLRLGDDAWHAARNAELAEADATLGTTRPYVYSVVVYREDALWLYGSAEARGMRQFLRGISCLAELWH